MGFREAGSFAPSAITYCTLGGDGDVTLNGTMHLQNHTEKVLIDS